MTPRTWAAFTALTAAALLTTACAKAGHTAPGQVGRPAPGQAIDCPQPRLAADKGAPATLGLNASGIQPPAWSSPAGHVSAVLGQTVFTTAGNTSECVRAVNAGNGRQLWNWSAAGHPTVMGVTAGQGIVIVATGHYHGHAPAMVAAFTDRLTALDAATGRELWTVALAGHGDSQTVPATITTGTVIVTQANGTVQALDAKTGAPRWTDALAPSCHPNTSQEPNPGVASIVAAQPSPVVLYQCTSGNELTALSPATGQSRWSWQAPKSWSVDTPPEAATTAGVIALVATGSGPATTSNRHAWTLGPQGYDPAQVLAIDGNTGRPLWELDDVDAAASVYASNGQICAASGYGVECLNARTGTESWQWRPAVTPGDELSAPTKMAVAAYGRIYLIAPSMAAAKINSQSTTQRSAPGTFVLQDMDLATGRIIATRPLPAYYGGGSSVVTSVDTPPGVAALAGSVVLVTPETDETDVVEAFGLMAG